MNKLIVSALLAGLAIATVPAFAEDYASGAIKTMDTAPPSQPVPPRTRMRIPEVCAVERPGGRRFAQGAAPACEGWPRAERGAIHGARRLEPARGQNGPSMSATPVGWLMHTLPVSSWRATLMPPSMSRVNSEPPRP